MAAGDAKTGVTLNPCTSEVLSSFAWRGGWYDFVSDIYGTLLIGNTGDWLTEAAASLGLSARQPAVTGAVTIDTVGAFAAGLGFGHRCQMNLPGDEGGVWTISHDSMSNDGPNPAADRTIHIDQYTGNVLADMRYADYSVYAKGMAKGIAWGIALHEGDMGLWNIALNTLFCLSIVFISASGLVPPLKRALS